MTHVWKTYFEVMPSNVLLGPCFVRKSNWGFLRRPCQAMTVGLFLFWEVHRLFLKHLSTTIVASNSVSVTYSQYIGRNTISCLRLKEAIQNRHTWCARARNTTLNGFTTRSLHATISTSCSIYLTSSSIVYLSCSCILSSIVTACSLSFAALMVRVAIWQSFQFPCFHSSLNTRYPLSPTHANMDVDEVGLLCTLISTMQSFVIWFEHSFVCEIWHIFMPSISILFNLLLECKCCFCSDLWVEVTLCWCVPKRVECASNEPVL